MNTTQLIEAARAMLPYTSEFEHDIIRVPVRNTNLYDIGTGGMQPDYPASTSRSFYEVEFRKQYIKSIAISWEFVNIY